MAMPGTRSCLNRSCGTQKLCVTSFDRRINSVGRLAGITSVATTASSLALGSASSSPTGFVVSSIISGLVRPNAPSFPEYLFFKQKTAYEIDCDWSSDVCSSDLDHAERLLAALEGGIACMLFASG